MAYPSNYTGSQVDLGVKIGLALASSSTTCTVTIDDTSVSVKVLWKTTPTSSNTVYGIAMHPTNGKLYRIKSTNNVCTAEEVLTGNNIDLSDYVQYGDATASAGTHSHTVSSHTHASNTNVLIAASVDANHTLSFTSGSAAGAKTDGNLTTSEVSGHTHTIPDPNN